MVQKQFWRSVIFFSLFRFTVPIRGQRSPFKTTFLSQKLTIIQIINFIFLYRRGPNIKITWNYLFLRFSAAMQNQFPKLANKKIALSLTRVSNILQRYVCDWYPVKINFVQSIRLRWSLTRFVTRFRIIRYFTDVQFCDSILCLFRK